MEGQAAQIPTIENTVTMDIEFKRRLPANGLRFIFSRAATRLLSDGRMDMDVTICNEDMELICIARQLILVLDAQRKFRSGRI